MDQRKLIKLGNSSFAIALPKNWIDKAGLKKGDNIFITPNSNGELIIQPKYKKVNTEEEEELSLEGMKTRDINREIIAAYINGINLIKLKFDKKNSQFVKEVLKDLFGVEIIESKHGSIIAKEVIDINSLSVESITRRIDNSVRNIFEDLEPCIKKGYATNKDYEEIAGADKDVNRFYFLLWRMMVLGVDNPSVLNTLQTNSTSLVYSWLTGMNLEKIGDDLKQIAFILSKKKLKDKELKDIEIIFSKLKENFINSLNSYHLKDKNAAFKVTQNKNEIKNMCAVDKVSPAMKDICELFSRIQSNIHYISKYILYFIKHKLYQE